MFWQRKCQECGHAQKAKDPKTYKDAEKEAWRDVKCKRCKSEALDYGREVLEPGDEGYTNENQ